MNDLSMQTRADRLVVASNRLPFVLSREQGRWKLLPGAGGLVSALAPVLRNRGGMWVGWPGPAGTHNGEDVKTILANAMGDAGYSLKPVLLTEDEEDKFYQGFSNEVIWPLFHDIHSHCNFDPGYWQAYQQVNLKFAQVIHRHHQQNDFIWVHDYHLMSVAKELRLLGIESKIGFFLHIPFPPLDIFLKLPWRFQLLRALLEYDLIGFQTPRDRRNFMQCLRTLLPDAVVLGKGQVLNAHIGGHDVRLGTFPIGIDYVEYARRASAPEVTELVGRLRKDLPNRQLILGLDRLDYTKGICERFEAFRNALSRYPDLHQKVTLIQVVVPSREDIPKYHALKMEMERLVGEINGQFTRPGWVPIHYMFRSLSPNELLAYYRIAEIALITPLKDGMNLVAKEFCAASVEEDGVLILSEFAGAAAQLQKGALMVNPYDVEGVADALYRAFVMPKAERRARMRKLRRAIREYDIFWWVDGFLRAVIAKDLTDFPQPEEYVPQTEMDRVSLFP